MGFFRRRSRTSRLSPDLLTILEQYGRWAFDPPGSGIDASRIGDERLRDPVIMAWGSEGPRSGRATRATDELSDSLAEAALPLGGWPVYGAYKLVVDLRDDLTHPSDVALMEAGLQFLRSRGVPWNSHLSPFEMQFWIARNPGGARDWIPWPDPPDPSQAPPDIEAGETRHMADILRPADRLLNRLYFRRGEDGYEAVIMFAGDPTGKDPFVQHTEPTLYQLCLTVGGALCTPPHWVAPELARFIPQPKMDLS